MRVQGDADPKASELVAAVVSEIHVACFFDDALALQASIMAVSLARSSTRENPVVLHAFFLGTVTEALESGLKKLHSPSFRIGLRQIDNPFHQRDVIPYSNPSYYLRLVIADLLPDLDRVLYLDVDLLVMSGLAQLYTVDLANHVVAAAPDPVIQSARSKPDQAQRMFLSSLVVSKYADEITGAGSSYMNTGVLVIDLKKWIAEDVKDRCLDFLRLRSHVIFADQDAINFVMRGEFHHIDSRWNFIPIASNDEAIAPDRIAILHFAGSKPWKLDDPPSMFDAEYWMFAARTPFGKSLRGRFNGSVRWHISNVLKQSRKMPKRFRIRDAVEILKKINFIASKPF